MRSQDIDRISVVFACPSFLFSFHLFSRPSRPVADQLDRSCSIDSDCPMDKSCVNRQCQDPCSLRDACGQNAICNVVLHKARCSCPQCHIGRPTLKCVPDPSCGTTTQRPVAIITTPRSPVKTTPRPTPLPIAVCARDSQCSQNHACNTNLAACQDPCVFKNVACDPGKRCEVRRHRPVSTGSC